MKVTGHRNLILVHITTYAYFREAGRGKDRELELSSSWSWRTRVVGRGKDRRLQSPLRLVPKHNKQVLA